MFGRVKRYLRYGRVGLLYVYLYVFQALNRTIIGTGKRQYEIRYVLHDRVYRFRTRMKRGPLLLTGAYDEKMHDITDELFSYLGPNFDFHGLPMSPRDLGHEKICLSLRDGRRVWVEGDCKIHLDEIHTKHH